LDEFLGKERDGDKFGLQKLNPILKLRDPTVFSYMKRNEEKQIM
jgi:hypothetical protein